MTSLLFQRGSLYSSGSTLLLFDYGKILARLARGVKHGTPHTLALFQKIVLLWNSIRRDICQHSLQIGNQCLPIPKVPCLTTRYVLHFAPPFGLALAQVF
jgi:hypothetical protein